MRSKAFDGCEALVFDEDRMRESMPGIVPDYEEHKFEWRYEQDRQRRKKLAEKNREIFTELEAALQVAEVKHPVFATSFDEGLMRVVEELGEIAQARNKAQGVVREKSEVLDLLCVAWRLYREDWRESAG